MRAEEFFPIQRRSRLLKARPPSDRSEVNWPTVHVANFYLRLAYRGAGRLGLHRVASGAPHPAIGAFERRDPGRGDSRLRFFARARRSIHRNDTAERSASFD